MLIALDGSNSATAASSAAPTITLTNSNLYDTIVVHVSSFVAAGTAPTVTTITDNSGQGLVYTPRTTVLSDTNLIRQDVWISSGTIAAFNNTITVHLSGTAAEVCLIAFGISGDYLLTPFDANNSLPAETSGTLSAPSVGSVSTTNSNTMVLAFEVHATTTAETAGAGYTLIASQAAAASICAAAQYKIVSSAQSNVTVAFGTSQITWEIIADAIIQDLQPWFETTLHPANRYQKPQQYGAAIAPISLGIDVPFYVLNLSYRQSILQGFPYPIYVNESGAQDSILPGVYLDAQAPYPIGAWGWETYWIQPPARQQSVNRYAAIAIGDDGIQAKFIAPVVTTPVLGFDIQQKVSRYPIRQVPTYDDGIEFPPIKFYPMGWEVQPPPPPHTRFEKSGAIALGDPGNEYTFSIWYNAGWEIQSWQPPHRAPEFKSGSIAKGDEGIEAVFVPPATKAVWGYDIYPTIYRKPIELKFGAITKGDDGNQYPLIVPFINGWEIQPWQPPHPRSERSGAVALGDSGTQGKLINWYATGWEIQPHQPQHPRPEMSGALAPWINIDAPLNSYQSAGWEIQSYQPQHVKFERTASIFRGDDGNQYPIIVPFVNGWEVQPWQPPHPRSERSGSIQLGDPGNQYPLINTLFAGWEIQSWQPPHRTPEVKFAAIEKGDEGIAAKLIPPTLIIWYEGTLLQPRHPRPESIASSLKGDEGNQLPPIIFYPSGWEIQSYQPPHRAPEFKFGAVAKGDDGTQGLYNFWNVAGWEIQSWQPPHTKYERSAAIDPWVNIDATFNFIFPTTEWEIQSWQPPHRAPELKSSAIAKGDEGNQLPPIIFYPSGWELQPFQPPHRAPEVKAASFLKGDEGNQYPLINTLFAGWEIQSFQPPHRAPELKFAAITKGDEGIEYIFFSGIVTYTLFGWEIQPWQPPHLRIEKAGAIQPISVIDAVFYNWRNAGWEIQSYQPQHVRFERAGAILIGDDGTQGKYNLFIPPGWEIQPWQPPHPRPEKWAAIAPWINIDEVLNFFYPYGWEVIPPQPPHPRFEKFGSIVPISVIDAVFYNWRNAGWEIQSFQPPHRAPELKFASIARGDEGNQYLLINWYVDGWEIQPWQPPHPTPEKRAGAIMVGHPGIEGLYISPLLSAIRFHLDHDAITRYQRPIPLFLIGDSGTQAPYFFRTHTNLIAVGQPRHFIAIGQPRNRIVVGVSNRMAQTNTLEPPIDQTVEFENITFDYGRILASGVILTGVVSITCSVATLISSANDPNPQSRFVNSPQIVASPKTGAPQAAVLQLFGGAVAGVEYLIQCVATTSDGQTLSLWTHLPAQQPM